MKHKTKRMLSLLLTFVMIVGLFPAVNLTAAAVTEEISTEAILLESSRTGDIELLAGKTYYIAENTVINNGGAVGDKNDLADDKPNKNGLIVKAGTGTNAGAAVTLCIPAGLTLTVFGKDGNRQTGGGAAILLPSGATLNVVGGGTLEVHGGKAGNGSNGSGGERSIFNDPTPADNDDEPPLSPNGSSYSGGGGDGGAGGGGGGAGIGTNGGDGGYVNGTGRSGINWDTDTYKDSAFSGASTYTAGKSGSDADAMGTLYVSQSIDIFAEGGAGGEGGTGGEAGLSQDYYNGGDKKGDSWRDIIGGAGGGGGGGGLPGAGIGTGGGGGGQGGGGGRSAYIWAARYVGAGGGGGGGGYKGGSGGDHAAYHAFWTDKRDGQSPKVNGCNGAATNGTSGTSAVNTSQIAGSVNAGGSYGVGAVCWVQPDSGDYDDRTERQGGNGSSGGNSGKNATSYTKNAPNSKWNTINEANLPSWAVTFDLTSATNSNGDQVLSSAAAAKLETKTVPMAFGGAMPRFTNKPTCEGYRFMGYWTDPKSGSGTQIIDADGNFVGTKQSIVLGNNGQPVTDGQGNPLYTTFISWADGENWNHVFTSGESQTLYAQWAKLPEVHLYENGTSINSIYQLAPDAIEDAVYLYRPSGANTTKVVGSENVFIKLSPMQDAGGRVIPGAYMAADAAKSVAGGTYSLFYRTAERNFTRMEKFTQVSGILHNTATVDSHYAEILYDLDYLSAVSAPNYIKLNVKLNGNQAAEDLVLTITPTAGYKLPEKDMLSVKLGGTDLDFTYNDKFAHNTAQLTVAAKDITGGPITVALCTSTDDDGGAGSGGSGGSGGGAGGAGDESALNCAPVFLKTVGGTLSASDLANWAKTGTHTYTRSVSTVVSLPTPVAPANSNTVKFDGWYSNPNYTPGSKVVSISSADGISTLYAKWVYSGLSETGNAMHYSYQNNYADLRGITASAGAPSGTWMGSSAGGSGDEVRITFANRGFEGFYHFGVLPEGNQNVNYGGTALPFVTSTGTDIFTKLDDDIYAAQVMAIEGNFITINYIVENRGSSALTTPLSIGAAADVAIGTNSNAPVLRTKSGDVTYLQFNESASDTTKSARIYLAGSGTTPVNRYWIGGFDSGNLNEETYWGNAFNNTSSNTNNGYDSSFNGSGDSAIAYSWTINSLAPGESVMYTVKVGVSEQKNLTTPNLTLDANGGQFDENVDIINLNSSDIRIENGTVSVGKETYVNPTRTGYLFNGWVYADGTAVPTDGTISVSVDTCIYASWVMSGVDYSIINASPAILSVADTAKRGQDITATLTAPAGKYLAHNISVTVVGGVELAPGTGYTYSRWNNAQSGTLLIYGAAVTGDIVITAKAEPGPAEVPTNFRVTVSDNILTASMTPVPPVTEIDELGNEIEGTEYSYHYQWYLSTDGTNQGGTTVGTNKPSYSHTATLPGSYYYYCVLTSTRDNGSFATLVSDPVAIHVDKYASTTDLTLNSWRYSDPAETPVVEVKGSGDNVIAGASAQVIYYIDQACTIMTHTDPSLGGAAAKGEKPTLPGAYFAVAYFTGNNAYKPSQSDAVTFTIYGTLDVPGNNAVVVPNIADLVYNGQPQTANVWSTDYYTVTGNTPHTDVGSYTVTLTINHPAEYRWAAPADPADCVLTENNTVATVTYVIAMVTNNDWVIPLSCDNIAFGETPVPTATAKFGNATYTYSNSENGTFGDIPSGGLTAGTWYVKAVVEETENYGPRLEQTIPFTVSASQWAKPAVTTMPTSVAGGSDGTITVTLPNNDVKWQYSVDGTTWSVEIAGSSLGSFPAGTYYVRLAADNDHAASLPVKVTVADGGMLTVTFNTDGGSIVASQSVEYGDTVAEPAVPAKTGYTFNNWYRNDLATVWNFDTYTITADTVIYAKWTANTYQVQFSANGKGTCTMANQDFTYDVEQSLNPYAITPDATYTFAGWNTEADGTGVGYSDKAVVKNLTTNGIITLYAQWVRSTFEDVLENLDLGGGSVSIPDNWNGILNDLVPNRNGYSFDGWESENGEKFSAKWTPCNYSITYMDGNTELTNTGGAASYTVESGAISLPLVTKEGFTFLGWKNQHGISISVIPAGSTGNLILSAQWKQIEATLSLPTMEGSNTTLTDDGNGNFILTITPEEGYGVPNNGTPSVKIGNTDATVTKNPNGSYNVTIPKSQLSGGNTSITISGIQDITAPAATVRFAGLQSSDALVNSVNFNTYFNSSKLVYITARDDQSEVVKVEYLISEYQLSEDALASANWKNTSVTAAESVNWNDSVGTSDGRVVVYVRVTDEAGNETYVSTNGVVFDSTAPEIIVKHGDTTTVENGAQIKIVSGKDIVAMLTDVNLDKVEVDGVEKSLDTPTGHTITNPLPKASFYTLTATDKAGNTTTFRVKVTAADYAVPSVASKVYTGSPLTPNIVSNDIYTVELVDHENDWVNGGSYTVKLTFTEAGKAQYQWVTTTASSDVTIDHVNGTATIKFNITQAENAFTAPLTLADTKLTYGDAPIPSASAKYGEVVYLYSQTINGAYTEINLTEDFIADETWYVKAQVVGTASYTGLLSDPVEFSIAPAPQAKPLDLAADNNNGKISGLTDDMEYSPNGGANWYPVSDPNMIFDPGEYKIRLQGTENSDPSNPVTIIIKALIVTFDTDGGSAVASQSVSANGFVSKPATPPTKTGYTFVDWYQDDLTTVWNFSTYAITADTVIYAKWTANTYQVQFSANDNGTCTMANQDFTYDVEQPLSPYAITHDATCTFVGWNTMADGSGDIYGDKAVVKNLTTSGSITLYAQWAELPGFDLNGGTLPEDWDGNTVPTPKLPGHSFGGWYDKNNPDQKVEDPATDGSSNVFAKWIENAYTVAFDPNGGTGTMDSQPFTYNTAQALASNTFVRANYLFTGWNTMADGSGVAYADQAEVKKLTETNNAIVTLYAQWEEIEVDLPESVPGADIGGGTFHEDGSYSFPIIPNPGYGIPDDDVDGKPSITIGGTPVDPADIELIDPQDPSKGYKVTLPAGNLPDESSDFSVEGFKDISKAIVDIYVGNTVKTDATLTVAGDPVGYFNSTQRISISAVNEISGITSISYFLSDTVLAENVLAGLAWQPYTASFNHVPGSVDGRDMIVYVKVINGDNQVSYYAGSKVVFDTVAPVITAVDKNNAAVSTGANVEGSVTVTVTDGTSLTVTGAGQPDNSGKYILRPSESTYTVIATDKAGNRSYFSVKPEFILINLPTIEFKAYTGSEQKADLPAPSDYYTAELGKSATNVGEFGSVILTLTAEALHAGYAFTSAGTSGSISALQASYIEIDHTTGTAIVPFGITQATNDWKTYPALGAATITYPATATVNAEALFGTVQITWSGDNGANWQNWTEGNRPILPGNYKVKVWVTGNANYTGRHVVDLNLTINAGKLDAPQLSGIAETVNGQGNGKIIGLTTAMEYRIGNDATWRAVTDPHMHFAANKTYSVRYKQILHTDNTTILYRESDIVTVPIGVGPDLKVTFLANDGTGRTASQSFVYDAAQNLTGNSFARANYTFTGWNTAADGSGTNYIDGASVTTKSDMVLYAQWAAATYTVTFLANEGSGTMDAQTFTHGETKQLTPNSFYRTDYTFNGWKDTSGNSYVNGASITVTQDLTLTAQWVLSSALTGLDLGGGTIDIPNPWDGSLSGLPSPSRNGYAFDGWVNEDGTPATGLPAKAKWTPLPNTVTFDDGTGNTNVTIPSGTTLKMDTDGDGTPDQTVIVEDGLTIENPVRDNHIFIGWEQTSNSDGSVTLTAKWVSDGGNGTPPDGIPDMYQKKVTFQVRNGVWTGSKNAENIVVYVTLTDNVGTVTLPTSTGIAGYVADGEWDDTNLSGIIVLEVSGTDAVTYTIIHAKNSVNIGNNGFVDGGDGSSGDGIADKPPVSNPIEIIVGNKIMVDPAGGVWSGFDGTGSFTTLQTYTINSEGTYNLTDPTRAGYTFVGWKTEEIGTTILFTAQWLGDTSGDGIPDQFQVKVTYRVNEGETWADGSTDDRFEMVILKDGDNWSDIGSGAASQNTPTATKDGYTHVGWYATTDTEQTNKLSKGGFTVTEEIILVPAWAEKEIEIEDEDNNEDNNENNSGDKPENDRYTPDYSENVVLPPSDSGSNVQINAEIVNKEAVIQPLKPSQIQDIINGTPGEPGTSDNAGGDVVIDLSGLKQTVEGIAIPKQTLETIIDTAEKAGNDETNLVIKLSTAELTVDQKALNAIIDQAQGSTIRFHFDDVGTKRLNQKQRSAIAEMDIHKGYEAYVTVNGKRISNFGGGSIELLIPFDLPAGYEVSGFSVWYIDEQGNLEKLQSTYDGKHKWFVATHFSDYVISYNGQDADVNNCSREETCPIHAFTDTSANAWYHNGIHYCIQAGLMNGIGNNLFAPGTTTTRSMVVTILWRLAGSPVVNYAMDFSDVAADEWYTEAIRWAASQGIVEGYAGKFSPNDPITREQFATILYRYEQSRGGGFTGAWMFLLDYTDRAEISDWAYEAMCWVSMKGIVEGKPGKLLDPKGAATRAEAATILWRFCENLK